MTLSEKIHAPFTVAQQAALNANQNSGMIHPYTCGNCRNDLVAEDRWTCPTPGCLYEQDWAHAFSVEIGRRWLASSVAWDDAAWAAAAEALGLSPEDVAAARRAGAAYEAALIALMHGDEPPA